MSTFEYDDLAALNPLSDRAAGRLSLDAAEAEMLDQITARPALMATADAAGGRRRLRYARRFGVVLAAAAAALTLFAVLPSSHDDGGPPPAFAAALVRFANASPLVLFESPSWRIQYADEISRQSGQLDYKNRSRFAALNWNGGSVASWQRDRLGQSSEHRSVRVLGRTGEAYRLTQSHDYSVVWGLGGRELEFSEVAPSMAVFVAELSKLHSVDATTWLRALPANEVRVGARATVVQQLLKNIPLPPGFNASQIRGAGLVRNRYQIGAEVTGTISCEWFRIWARGRTNGDQVAVSRAVAAMATAKNWPVLQQMRRQGGWTAVLLQFAAAMPTGHLPRVGLVGGRPAKSPPFLASVNSGLGCSSEWGVPLPR